jgi:uncharacterized membrane-anchored protein YhcB (DUF1043 family)
MNDRRMTNGARAAQIAAEKFVEIEDERDDLREEVAMLKGRVAEQADMLDRLMADRDAWLNRAVALAQSIMSTSQVLVEAAGTANNVLNYQSARVQLPPADYPAPPDGGHRLSEDESRSSA